MSIATQRQKVFFVIVVFLFLFCFLDVTEYRVIFTIISFNTQSSFSLQSSRRLGNHCHVLPANYFWTPTSHQGSKSTVSDGSQLSQHLHTICKIRRTGHPCSLSGMQQHTQERRVHMYTCTDTHSIKGDRKSLSSTLSVIK